jgi:membrane-bound metal-dependent hydrolase YbcI (DUF457 family)
MASPIGHGLAGYALFIFSEPRLATNFRDHLKAAAAGFFFGSLADADFLVDYFTNNPVLEHHYFTHSISFNLLLGVLIFIVLKAFLRSGALRLALILTGVYATHLFVDYFTHDGSPPIGIPLLWPFTHRHFIAPVDIFLSIHRGSIEALFGPHNMYALLREIVILGPLAAAAFFYSRRYKAIS